MSVGSVQPLGQGAARDKGISVAGPTADGIVDPQVLQALVQLDTPTVSNAIELFRIRDRCEGFTDGSVRTLFPELGVRVGYAVTARITARAAPDPSEPDLLEAYFQYLLRVPPPRWVVIQDVDSPPGVGSFWGEVNGNIHRALGCVGVITNGCVRDLPAMREVGFQAIAGSIGVSHGWVRVIEFGKPVTVAGLTVRSGDLIHADQHGAILVPKSIVARIPQAAAAVVEHEQAIVDLARQAWASGQRLDLEELKRLRQRMREALAGLYEAEKGGGR